MPGMMPGMMPMCGGMPGYGMGYPPMGMGMMGMGMMGMMNPTQMLNPGGDTLVSQGSLAGGLPPPLPPP